MSIIQTKNNQISLIISSNSIHLFWTSEIQNNYHNYCILLEICRYGIQFHVSNFKVQNVFSLLNKKTYGVLRFMCNKWMVMRLYVNIWFGKTIPFDSFASIVCVKWKKNHGHSMSLSLLIYFYAFKRDVVS